MEELVIECYGIKNTESCFSVFIYSFIYIYADSFLKKIWDNLRQKHNNMINYK